MLAVGVFYVVYCIIAFIIAVVVYYSEMQADLPHVYNYSLLLFLIFVLSFYGLRQQALPKQLLVEKLRIPYEHSNLSDDVKKRIETKVMAYFENEKAYLNPELNMELLAQTLRIPKHQITEVLNTNIGKNFFQFVNTFRVDAVKKMLLDPKNKFSIEAIGYECGFSSKSSFYTVFKSITGVTPVEFKNKSSR